LLHMLKELSKYENLGTPKVFHEIFKLIEENKQSWTPKSLKEYFFNRIIDGQSIFDGCVPFALSIGAILKAHDETVSLSSSLQTTLINEKYFSFKLLEMVFSAVKDDDIFHEIFNSRTMSFDVIYDQIQIDRGAFQFRFANFRHLLLSFSFLQEHPEPTICKFIIHHKYRKLFNSSLLPEIKRRKIGIEQLEKMLAQKQIYGTEAEEYVLNYEMKRLEGHPKISAVQIISAIDTAAGFDIVSFDAIESHAHDRFIEVKSYAGQPSFHWSRNEIEKASYMKNLYFLYLVDRAKMKDDGYEPLKIQNPHDCILSNGASWEKRVEEYFFRKLPM
jgi:Domain of unknown function (DUF3883)